MCKPIYRFAKGEGSVEVPCPSVVALYNKKMGGVDLNDMMVEHNRLPIRSEVVYVTYWLHD